MTANTKMSNALREVLEADAHREQLFTTQGINAFLISKGQPGLFKYSRDPISDVETFDFSGGFDSNFNGVIQRGFINAMGHHIGAGFRHKYPVDLMAKCWPRLLATMQEFGYAIGSFDADNAIDDDVSDIHPGVAALAELLSTRIKALEKSAEAAIEKGEIVFDELPFFFKPGKEVIVEDGGGQLIAGTVAYTEVKRTWFGTTYLNVMIDIIHGVSGSLMPGKYATSIGSYLGVKKIDALPIKAVTAAQKAELTKRGRLYVDCVTKPTYLSYKGSLTRASWWASETFRADGRVMIDVGSFQRIENDQFDKEKNATGIHGMRNHPNEGEGSVTNYVVKDGDLWKTFPYVYGFSFRAKRWGRMTVADLSPIQWRKESFDQLVLPEDEKKMVRALVEHNDGSFSDIIEGKGGGCIFLLHGPPGQGKTLTAETIAELLKRPLYAISVGELGVTPDQLEERLRVILDVATVWNAVILLDEADIYLEERDEHDIMRNAMVGVFLRLLEYHHGVLFLTTNRVKHIDRAFYSRISVALSFPEGDNSKREKIWSNLLDSAGLKGLDVKRLAAFQINGRQIKNAIRLSQTLAKADNKTVSMETVEKVISLMTAFDRERSEASGS